MMMAAATMAAVFLAVGLVLAFCAGVAATYGEGWGGFGAAVACLAWSGLGFYELLA